MLSHTVKTAVTVAHLSRPQILYFTSPDPDSDDDEFVDDTLEELVEDAAKFTLRILVAELLCALVHTGLYGTVAMTEAGRRAIEMLFL